MGTPTETTVTPPAEEVEVTEQPLKTQEEIDKEMGTEGTAETTDTTEGGGAETPPGTEKKEEVNKEGEETTPPSTPVKTEKQPVDKDKQLTESQREGIRLNAENKELKGELDSLQNNLSQATDYINWRQREDEVGVYNSHFQQHKDFYSDEDVKAFQQVLDTPEVEDRIKLIEANPNLKKLNEEFTSLAFDPNNPIATLNKRLEKAFKLAFHDDILKRREKQGTAKAELAAKEKDNLAAKATQGTGKGKQTSFTQDQIDVAEKMGISPEQLEQGQTL